MPYLSQLLGTPVTAGQTAAGRVRDAIVPAGPRPSVAWLVLDDGRHLPWNGLRWEGRTLRGEAGPVARDDAPDEVRLAAGLLDRQILDARGRKVVRVNDVRLDWEDDRLRVTGVDVSARGFLRRLGFERAASWLADRLGYTLPDDVIPWSYVTSLSDEAGVRLGIDADLLAKLRPVEVAEILDALGSAERARLVDVMEDRILARALHGASPDVREETLDRLGDGRASAVVAAMRPDDAVDVLGGLPEQAAERLLTGMAQADRDVLRELLGYHPRTAGGLMTPRFVAIPRKARVGEAIEILRRAAPGAESVYYVYAVDERGTLQGVVSLRDLLTTSPDTQVAAIERPDIVRVHVHDPDDRVAEVMERYDLLALPVVDDRDRLLGMITIDDIMQTVEAHAADDLAVVTGTGEFRGPPLLAAGRLGASLSALAGGLVAALVLVRLGVPASGAWMTAAALPLILRLTQDQGAWALAAHLEEDGGPSWRRALAEVAASTLAATPPAVAFGVGALASSGRRFGLALGLAVVLASATAAALGLLVPGLLEAPGRTSILRRGRLVPIVACLGGLAVYLVVLPRNG